MCGDFRCILRLSCGYAEGISAGAVGKALIIDDILTLGEEGYKEIGDIISNFLIYEYTIDSIIT